MHMLTLSPLCPYGAYADPLSLIFPYYAYTDPHPPPLASHHLSSLTCYPPFSSLTLHILYLSPFFPNDASAYPLSPLSLHHALPISHSLPLPSHPLSSLTC